MARRRFPAAEIGLAAGSVAALGFSDEDFQAAARNGGILLSPFILISKRAAENVLFEMKMALAIAETGVVQGVRR